MDTGCNKTLGGIVTNRKEDDTNDSNNLDLRCVVLLQTLSIKTREDQMRREPVGKCGCGVCTINRLLNVDTTTFASKVYSAYSW